LDCRHVCNTCVFHDAIQAGIQKEVHPPYSPDLARAGARSGKYGGLVNFFLLLPDDGQLTSPKHVEV
jgi:hypothetical protein